VVKGGGFEDTQGSYVAQEKAAASLHAVYLGLQKRSLATRKRVVDDRGAPRVFIEPLTCYMSGGG